MGSRIQLALVACITILCAFAQKSNPYPYKITQDEQVYFITEEITRISLAKRDFNFLFPLTVSTSEKKHNIKVATFVYEQDAADIKVGQSISDIPCFQIENVFPGSKACYPALFMYQEGYHQLIYETSNTGYRRGNHISTLADGRLLLEWTISAVCESIEEPQEAKQIAISEWTGNRICLVILEDANQNNIIDKGELHKAYLSFQ